MIWVKRHGAMVTIATTTAQAVRQDRPAPSLSFSPSQFYMSSAPWFVMNRCRRPEIRIFWVMYIGLCPGLGLDTRMRVAGRPLPERVMLSPEAYGYPPGAGGNK